MLNEKITIEAVSESSILIRFSDQIEAELPLFINQVAEIVFAQHDNSIMNLTPSYTTLLIDYLPYRTSENQMLMSLAQILHLVDDTPIPHTNKTVTIPVYYDSRVAPDLTQLLKDKSLSLNELITLHTEAEYTVCAMGFAPGFAFLSGLNPKLSTPRHTTPRLKVMAGSVGLADNQTAVYPSITPGGWKIIGNSPISLFDPNSDQLSPFRIGDKIKFESIDLEQFNALGGQLWDL